MMGINLIITEREYRQMIAQRKKSLQLVSNGSTKLIPSMPPTTTAKTSKGHKYRGSLHKPDENLISNFMKSAKPDSTTASKKDSSFALVDQSTNIPASYRNSFEESLLNKIRKLGYVSQGNSKQSSPARRKKQPSQENSRNTSTVLEPSNKYMFSKSLFTYEYAIGRGGFGKVWKVELKRNKRAYALKEMSKALIIAKKSVPSVMNEKRLLASLKHDFLVNMVQAFQDRETLYLVMDYLPGGDLRHHISRKKKFTESEAKFIIACVFLGLEYLHEKNIIHRDIKPENLVLDEKGYVRITDLGVARQHRPNNSSDTSGTPGYMAPEVLCRQNHTFSVDHFALGVIAFELMMRRRPYYGRNRRQIRDEVLGKQVQIKKHEIPDDWSLQAADFINRLIQRKPASRLGFQSSAQIRNHPWLRQYPFDKLSKKQFTAPFIPDTLQSKGRENQCTSQNTEMRELISQNELLLREDQVQQLFEGYESTY